MRHGGKLPNTRQGFQIWRQAVLAHSGSVLIFHQLLVPANDEVARLWQRDEQNVGYFAETEYLSVDHNFH